MRTSLVTALVILMVIDAMGWALGTLPTLAYALKHGSLPSFLGIRALSGPFEALGIPALVVAGIVFVATNLLKLLAAYWTWNLRMDGLVLQLILMAVSAIFWYGFALPFGAPLGLIEVVLMSLTWRSFS